MNRYIYILIMWLCSLSAIAQTEGYNPNNPPLPDFPTDEPKDNTYVLVVNSSPYGSGSLNTSGGNYKEGASVYLRAYNNGDMYFMYWIDDEGNTLTTSTSFNYTMPKRDAVVTAVYRYSPSNPALPDLPEDTNIPTYNLKLDTKPAGAGSFNTSNTNLKEGESIHLYAYSNSNFYFKRWEDAQGNVISTAQNFYYSMPAVDTQLYAIYTYNPSNPANPGKNFYDSFTGEVIIDDFTKGNLSSAIYDVTKGNTSNITSITVAGVINSNDFSIANNYSSCSIVDLSRTNGVNTVPSYCYDGNTHLNRLSLPACITNIEYRAFRNATALTELTCHATVPPTLGSNVFSGVNKGLVVYVPASSIQLYEQAAGWKEYEADGTIVIMPIQSQVSALEVNLPAECADGRYKNMPLELLNVKSGQKFKYVITDRINYTFNNLVNGTRYVATLKNLSGQVLAKTDTISITDENVSVTFDLANMKQLRSVKASVLTKEGTDVTSNCVITWYDANGTFLSQSKSLEGQVSETKVSCAVSLSQALAMEYVLPKDSLYEVLESENNVIFMLAPLPKMQLSGRILDVTTQQGISNANITVSQTLNGKYSKSFSGKTDNKGAYTMTVFAVPSSVTYASNDYVSQTVELADSVLSKDSSTLADVKLKPITGATITTNFTYTTSVAAGIDPEIQNYYSDYNNVAYNIYNVTAQKEIRQFNVQYPNIVLLEEVNQGDSLQIIAKSKVGSFVDVTIGGRINDALRMDVIIPVVQLGGIDATFTTTENSKVLGILYDSKGTYVNKYTYGTATLSIRELKDGEYTLVTMGASDFFGSIYNLEKFSEAGLQQNIDYLVNKVTVKSGIISPLKNVLVPFFDESKFYYTGDNTSFTVNKTSIVAGNYLTLTAKVDFKPVYASSISDVKISVELPEGTSMVDNSVMVGSKIAYYEIDGNTLIVPLDNNAMSDRVRFCVIPTQSGSFAPNASVAFKLGEKSVSQPMGSAPYMVKDVSIKVPSNISKTEFAVSGTANGRATVYIYDGNTLLGETTALANGFWGTTVELENPYNLSSHNIYAKIITKEGAEFMTPTKEIVYDENSIEVSKVKMYHWNPETNKNYELVFDFQNPSNKPGSYVYYIYNKKFTFTIDFTSNDTTKVSDVVLYVKTGKGKKVPLKASFSEKQKCWIAEGEFGNMYDGDIPVNVSVRYGRNDDFICDYMHCANIINNCMGCLSATDSYIENGIESYVISSATNFGEIRGVNYTTDSVNLDKIIQYVESSPFEYLMEHSGKHYYITSSNAVLYYFMNNETVRCEAIFDIADHEYQNMIEALSGLNVNKPNRCASPVPAPRNALERMRDRQIQSAINEANRKLKCYDEDSPEAIMMYDNVQRLRNSVVLTAASLFANWWNVTGSITSGDIYNSTTGAAGFGDGMDGISRSGRYALQEIHNAPNYCGDDDDDDDDQDSGNDDADNTIDPSGYVYEGVSSNRLQGVTTTAYYKELVEDMYGDLHENIVLWDAEEYAQKNPLFTDENGQYAWDVPEGLWQVKYEKEGYVTTYSDWLPVPPPQLDVNIGMVQNAQPEVVSARAYEDGVEIEFSKYMNIESLNSENVYLKVVSGEEESLITDAEIQMLNKEVTIEGSTTEFASKMKLATDQLGYYDEAYVIVSTGVNSYAGIPMAQTFEQKLDVEKKVRELLVDAEFNVEYDGQKEVTIAAIPADAAVGKKLSVVSASDMIATTDVQEVTFDADGQATFTVNGELYGATAINYSLMDADLKATSLVNVVDPVKLEAVKAPMASRISGTAVYRGQTVTLTCESEGATIYYTTDGSCPCDENARKKYERPIAINDAMTLKFMAVGPNFDESDVIECTYSIRQSDVKLALAKGWNWNSHDVASPVDVSELSGVASRILTQTDEVIDDPVLGFVGTLTSIEGSETMKIEAKESANKSFTGEQYNPALSPIVLHEGWNWLGYPISQTMTLADALSYMDTDEGDCISNLEGGFATFNNGEWEGSLQTMNPGAGYLYKSASAKSFIYNNVPTVLNARALYRERLAPKSIPWSVDKHRYPNLMPMIAQVCYSTGDAADSTYYVGAFVGNECRGVGKYSDGIMYLSVYGDKSADMNFKAWNVETESVFDFAETLKFTPDVVGTNSSPYKLMLGFESTGINHLNANNGVDGIYSIQGIKLNSIPNRGIYIIKSKDENGNSIMKKTYVK